MKKENLIILLSAVFTIFYDIFNVLVKSIIYPSAYTKLDILMLVLSIIGVIYFIYFAFSKKDISTFKVPIIFFSIMFFTCNVISGILGFVVVYMISKKNNKELPKLSLLKTHKWYLYVLVLVLCLSNLFFFSNYYKNTLELIISYVVMMIILILLFRKELLRDLKEFKKNFKVYNSFVLSTYGKSLVVLFILSISIRLSTNLEEATNQENIISSLDKMPILVGFLTVVYAPIAEELMFRGIFRKLINNKWLFILISGLLFGAAHVIDDYQSVQELLYIFVYGSLGCFLAYVYYKTNNLCANIYFHFLQNFLSILMILLLNIIQV